MHDLILQHIAQHIQLDEAEKAYFSSLLKHRRIAKRQFLLQEGEVCRHEYFVVKGCLRTYEMDEGGQEHVLMFSIENWWAGDLYSFFTNTPTRYNVEALEDTDVLMLDFQAHQLLYERVPKFERYFRILFQNAFIALQRRVISNISKTAEERYLEFLERYPTLEQRVPQHQIASYLGITPESLSRIRRQRRIEK